MDSIIATLVTFIVDVCTSRTYIDYCCVDISILLYGSIVVWWRERLIAFTVALLMPPLPKSQVGRSLWRRNMKRISLEAGLQSRSRKIKCERTLS